MIQLPEYNFCVWRDDSRRHPVALTVPQLVDLTPDGVTELDVFVNVGASVDKPIL